MQTPLSLCNRPTTHARIQESIICIPPLTSHQIGWMPERSGSGDGDGDGDGDGRW
jgi:hypothetical protein